MSLFYGYEDKTKNEIDELKISVDKKLYLVVKWKVISTYHYGK